MTPTPNNFVQHNKGNQNPLTVQEIFRRTQIQRAKLVLVLRKAQQPLNMRQLAGITGIERPTICRRISELQADGLVELARYGICPISKYPRVGFYAYVKKGDSDGDSKA